MEGIVADLVVGTHGVNGLTCRLKSSAVEVAMSGSSSGMTRASIRTGGPQVHRELLPERFGNRRLVLLAERQEYGIRCSDAARRRCQEHGRQHQANEFFEFLHVTH